MSLWTPANLATTPLCWLKADSLSLSNGAAVATWTDSSGSSHDGTQVTSGKRPTYQTNVINGLPTVRFNTANSQGLELTNMGAALSGDNSHSWFFVSKPSDLTNYPILLTYPVDAPWAYIVEYDMSGDLYWGAGSGNGVYKLFDVNFGTSNWSLISLVKSNATTTQMWTAGTEVTTYTGAGVAATPSMSGNIQLGSYVTATYGMQGDIAEVICLPNAASDADRQFIEGYLAHRYALTSQLGAGHPYKSSAPSLGSTNAFGGSKIFGGVFG